MRTWRIIVVVPLAVLCGIFLVCYTRIECLLWQMRDDRGIHLLAEPHVCVYRAFTHNHGERDGWTLFLLTDAPEGTRSIFYFPTWPLAIASVGVLVYATFTMFEWRGKRVVQAL